MDPYCWQGTKGEGKAPLAAPAGLGSCMGVAEPEVGSVNGHCYFLGRRKVRQRSSAALDGFIGGTTEVEGSSGSLICLHITLPL